MALGEATLPLHLGYQRDQQGGQDQDGDTCRRPSKESGTTASHPFQFR